MTEQTAQSGQRVKVHYTGKLESGEQFDSSKDREPLSFQLGQKEVIKGFEDAIIGMKPGEKKTITLEPKDAYGTRDERLVQDVPKSMVEGKIDPKEGAMVALQSPEGHKMMAKIVSVSDEIVKFDMNPPLAGKTLIFELELVEIIA